MSLLSSLVPTRVHGLGWSFDDIPSQNGKRAVVTGANSGIGLDVCKKLLDHGLSDLVMASRSKDKVQHAADTLRDQFPQARISAHQLDMADFASVRTFASDLQQSNKHIDLLVNNAGRYVDTPFEVTKDGFEIQLKTNYYGHVYLTQLLLPYLAERGPVRIVNVASQAETFGKLDWSDLRGTKLGTSGIAAYGRSKLFFLMYSLELHRRLKLAGTDIDVFPVEPGVVNTPLLTTKVDWRYPFAVFSTFAGPIMGLSSAVGAMSALYAATEPGLTGGTYIGPSYIFNTGTTMKRTPWNPAARDADARQRLFDATLDILQEATGSDVPRLVTTLVTAK